MSTTTTENETVYRTAGNVLADYELRYTCSESEPTKRREASTIAASQRDTVLDSTNPPDWPSSHRRVPPHRPVNHELDPTERYVFLNNGERMFVNMMLMGVRINATINSIWRSTGGKLNDRIFRYDLGGES